MTSYEYRFAEYLKYLSNEQLEAEKESFLNYYNPKNPCGWKYPLIYNEMKTRGME